MSELRKAMIDQMLLKGFSERTKKSYLHAVSLLARHYHLPPDKLSRSDIQKLVFIPDKGSTIISRHLSFIFKCGTLFLPSGFAAVSISTGTGYTEAPTADTGFIITR